LTPFNERGGAVLFENVAAVEVAILVEVVVDRGMARADVILALRISLIDSRPESNH